MAIKELNLTGGAAAGTSTQREQKEANVWLNIGYTAKDANGEEIFIGLPLGVPVDTMTPQPIRGKNAEFNALVQAKNALLEMIQKAGEGLEAGDEFILSDLKIQLRRRNETAQVDGATNPLLAAMPKIG